MSVPTPILTYSLSDATMKGLLPSGYTPLAYIESTGTLWINSDIALNGTTSTYIFSCKVGASTRDSHPHSFFGTASYLTGMMGIYHYTNNNYYSECIANSNKGTQNKVILKGNIFEYYLKMDMSAKTYASRIGDSSEVTGSFNTMSDTTTTIRVFKSDDYPGGYWKCYYFRIAKDNILQVDLIPARRDSDGVIGMYDLVSRTFKTNSGSGTFIAGPELAVGKGGDKSLPEEYLLVEYLESTGDLYINTTYTPQSNVTIKSECSLAITASLPDNAFWGSYNTSSGYRSYPLCIYNNKPFYGNSTGNVGLNSGSVSLLTIGTFYTLCTENGPSSSNMKVNEILIISQSSSNTVVNSVNYSMFARRHGTSGSDGNIQCKSKIKLQWLRHYENGVIKFNFIPCYRKSDMKPGMYDVVNGVFYTNAGSGEFILGPSITNCYTSEPNAGSGTLQGLYTNLSGIYDSSKGWVADFTNNITHLSTTIPAIGNNFSVAWWELSSNFNDGTMPWGIYPFNPLYAKCLNTGDGGSNPWYKSGTTAIDNISNNVWHHFVVTGNGSANYLYVDGIKYGLSKTFRGLTGTSLVINGWLLDTSYCRNPKISNFQIFNVALTDAQVKELYGQ